MEHQMTLFTENNHAPLAGVSSCAEIDSNGVDINDAPVGFFAELKQWKGYNICRDCDARKLCQENKDDWCLKNRCMSYDIVSEKDGKTYGRKDGKSVIFKKR
jgi:hypothetical protein